MSDGNVSSFSNSRAGAAGTLLFSRSDVERLLTPAACMAAVEDAFRQHALGQAPPPGILSLHAEDGGFHIKAALLTLDRPYFAAKTNANFPDNPARHSLPTIQGVIVLADAERGVPLALIDSMEITTLRTGAATAIATKHLARPDARTATIVGCGAQGRVQLRAVKAVCALERAYACDQDFSRAQRFAREMGAALGLEVEATADVAGAARKSDVIVTCTPVTSSPTR